jgi:hypothetical protein
VNLAKLIIPLFMKFLDQCGVIRHDMRRSDQIGMVIVNPGNVSGMQAVEAPG